MEYTEDIMDKVRERINEFVETIEVLCDDEADAFWEDIDKMMETMAFNDSDVTKELLNSIEHIFTRTEKEVGKK